RKAKGSAINAITVLMKGHDVFV
ncbi:MAG: hypothetical protein QOE68_4000, partial [Thermoanaerobaculia bacterium]|nr:hypothetical protein [Thermoanaerobaculia bacterium]